MRSSLPIGARRSPLWVEALIVAWLAWAYDRVTSLAPLRAHLAVHHAWAIWHAEVALHLDPELALNRWLWHHHTLGQVASYYYDNAHFIVTFGALAFLWWRRPDIYRPLRNSLALVNVLAFAVFWLYPLAPPRMLASVGFWDVVGHSNTFGQWHTGALASSADQFAAMPSLHISWAVWSALVLWRVASRRWVRAVAVLYPCLTAAVIFATGNHFFLDAVGGLAAIVVAVGLVEWVPRSVRSRSQEPTAASAGDLVPPPARGANAPVPARVPAPTAGPVGDLAALPAWGANAPMAASTLSSAGDLARLPAGGVNAPMAASTPSSAGDLARLPAGGVNAPAPAATAAAAGDPGQSPTPGS